jgi:23S rRNA G2069 N7-methylase RlmK/C1962 C5-methylase RlmI
MDYIKITLKPGKEDSFHRFHPWVFSGAIYRFEKQPEEGDIVEVTDHQGNFIGIGQYQIGSIAVRILTFKPEEINEQFYFKRLQEAYNVRLSLGEYIFHTTHVAFQFVHSQFYSFGKRFPESIMFCDYCITIAQRSNGYA